MTLLPATRPADWPARLLAFAAERRALPFAWGSNDCATFAAAWVRALHGVDLLAEHEIAYNSAAGAAVLLRGNDGLQGLATRMIGAPLQAPALARRGDLLLVELDGRESLAVCDGATLLGPGETGLQVLPIDWAQVRAAWRV